MDTIEAIVDLVDDPDAVEAETCDSYDDYLIALARAHDVAVIVSGDKDLVAWEPQRPTIVTPAQFEDRDAAS